MAHSEACQVYIEQEIKEGLKKGKTPWSIGKELSKWIEELFKTNIPPNTIAVRARRINEKENICTNVQKESNNETNTNTCVFESITHPQTERGGKREGAGRPKVENYVPSVSTAMRHAEAAISRLNMIDEHDSEFVQTMDYIIDYCQKRKAGL